MMIEKVFLSYIFQISKKILPLAIAEIEELLEIKLTEFIPSKGLYLGLIDSKLKENFLSKIKRLSLTKRIFFQVTIAEYNECLEAIDKIPLEKIRSPFKIITCIDENRTDSCDSKSFADLLFKTHTNNNFEIDIHNPKFKYACFSPKTNSRNKQMFFCEEVFCNEDSGEERRSHLKKWNHPTSTHPLISKAMINLANSEEFYDPFCGSGGLLIEGSLIGLKVLGSDISKAMIGRAKENCEAMNLDIPLRVEDALKSKIPMETIVTDLPFGKNSMVAGGPVEEVYLKFLKHSENLSETMVVGFKEGSLTDEIISKTSWVVKRRISYYVHKSMTRTIILLKNKKIKNFN